MRRGDAGPLRSQRLELPDGDFVDLQEGPDRSSESAPVTLVLHGLEGSARANYVSSQARELAACGLRPVRMNFRACSGEMNRLPRFYHAADTSDVDFVVRHLREGAPGRKIAIVGFSLGGSILLKYLGERGAEAKADVAAAVAISVPFDLSAGTGNLERPGMSRVYSYYFLRKLRAKVRQKRHLLRDHCDLKHVLAARSVREYDDRFTARLHGFRDAWHYYETASSARWIEEIRVPTAILHALDDPFLPASDVPLATIRENPNIIGAVTPTGGHVGFVTGSPWKPVFWAEREAARFVARHLTAATRGNHVAAVQP